MWGGCKRKNERVNKMRVKLNGLPSTLNRVCWHPIKYSVKIHRTIIALRTWWNMNSHAYALVHCSLTWPSNKFYYKQRNDFIFDLRHIRLRVRWICTTLSLTVFTNSWSTTCNPLYRKCIPTLLAGLTGSTLQCYLSEVNYSSCSNYSNYLDNASCHSRFRYCWTFRRM